MILISGISNKVIFIFLLFINFIQPSKSADFEEIISSENNLDSKLSSLKISNIKYSQNLLNQSESLLAVISEKENEIVIQSDKQSEINDVIYAEGNVYVSYRGKLLKADNLTYDKLNKEISAKGNILLIFGDQIFKVSQLEYSFISKKGYLLDVQGYINSNTLMEDLSSNFSLSDSNKIEGLLKLEKNEVLNTPDKVNNWIFSTQRITIDGKKWKSNKAIFSNDILQSKQVKLEINSLEAYSLKEELRFRSSLNYLVLDENVSIPFWFGSRAFNKSAQNDLKSSWSIGYDKLDKDGLFIGRKLNSFNLSDDFIINLEPQFLIQRSINGKTKSFVKKGDLITGEKVERDAEFADYFGVKSEIKGKVNNWDLEIVNQINSFDTNKFSDALRFKSILNKEINFLNAKWDKSFYGVYRDRVWNGSLGETEIYAGYGSKLEKKHTWEVKGINKTEVLSLGLAHLKGEALFSKNLVDSPKGNLFYSLDQNIPISVDKPKSKMIDSSYEYIYEPIKKGLSLNTRLAASYSLYDDGKHQEYIGFGFGPELILGNFKTKTFDYTRISIFPYFKLKNGDSIFKFDQISDKFTLDIGFDQQLFGPIMLKSSGTINLDSDSNDYGEFINSKISLNWKKRSYEFGIFYQPHNQAGGILFNLFGFK
ncbi:Repeats containing protein [Prochlorococcus marinus str. MIT 9302]|uniref:Repeats containing protein n=1 Tax=Prochlorococcus marinus str. MIT 9302 TaxID=74545 RepID=A0A0A2A2V5_PROMR|nr:Repeats containing protein [Prochlorococcus marinus str. MIT 9302]